MNETAWVEYELAFFEAVVQYFCHDTTKTVVLFV